ncbi:MAG: hypothetical protein K8S20_10125 [Chloroflexi bacterium]|nr:hypothetical protein [Chloroflexota bacterium]
METETRNRHWLPIALLALLIAAAGWYYLQNQNRIHAQEQPVTQLQLAGPIAAAEAELSGLGWHADTLILLPQYPERFGKGDGTLFALPKADILSALDGAHQTPLEPALVSLNAPGLKESIPNYQGYESIAFNGDQVFLTIEAGEGTDMHGYLVSGTISADSSTITLDPSRVTEIPMAFPSANHSDEAILIEGDSILTFFELNGAGLNPAPAAHTFDFDLQPRGTISFPNLEYRVTDAAADSGDSFWVVNYFFPGDIDQTAKIDPLVAKYGEGPTHAQQAQVERLVQMKYTPNGITLADSAPVQLSLDGDTARNIEGLALLDQNGFLLVTDKFPSTMLMFVRMPK